ncbi:MAG: aminotransferase class IV [Dehalococcoidales bacterium]
MEELVCLNGSLIPRSKAKVSAFDHGFLYGYGLFETMRAYNGKIFLLGRHLKRLFASAESIGLDSVLSDIDLEQACFDVLKANNLKDARMRLTITRGDAGAFPGTRQDAAASVLITATAYTPLPAEAYEKGYKALISSFRRDSGSLLSGLKSTGYLLSVLAKREAENAGMDEALLLNERGFIAEGSISNVFFVAHGELFTPPAESGILPGITREAVLELATGSKIRATEADIRVEDLSRFDEAFLTNSVLEIMPLVAVRDKAGKTVSFGSGKPDEITKRLISAYREMVARETG